MDFKEYYKILGVAADADLKAIKTAYRKLARKYHPDVSQLADAAERFKEVAEAYEVLGDDKKRAEYDEIRKYGGKQYQRTGANAGAAGGGGYNEQNFSDFFSSVFGDSGFGDSGFGGSGSGGPGDGSSGQRRTGGFGDNGGGFSARGGDLEIDLPVLLEETLSTESRQISYKLPQVDAHGGRLASATKTLNVKIPKGVSDGERIRLKGQGAPGVGGAAAGDLYLRVRLVPHPLFDIEAHNLLITVPLAPWEAALGGKITLPTLQGKIQLTIPPDSQTGQRLRIKGRGLPMKNANGDLLAVLKIVLPAQTDKDAKVLWQQLADKHSFDPRQDWS